MEEELPSPPKLVTRFAVAMKFNPVRRTALDLSSHPHPLVDLRVWFYILYASSFAPANTRYRRVCM